METRHCLSDHSVIQDPGSGSRPAKPQSGTSAAVGSRLTRTTDEAGFPTLIDVGQQTVSGPKDALLGILGSRT